MSVIDSVTEVELAWIRRAVDDCRMIIKGISKLKVHHHRITGTPYCEVRLDGVILIQNNLEKAAGIFEINGMPSKVANHLIGCAAALELEKTRCIGEGVEDILTKKKALTSGTCIGVDCAYYDRSYGGRCGIQDVDERERLGCSVL